MAADATLYDVPVSNNGARIRIAIYAKGLEDRIEVKAPTALGGLKSDEYVSRGVGRFVSPPLADAIIVADTDSPICGRPKRPTPRAPHAPIAGTSCSIRMTFCTMPR